MGSIKARGSTRYNIDLKIQLYVLIFIQFSVLTVTWVPVFPTAVAGPAETRRHAELGAASLVLRRVASRIVAHDTSVDPYRRVRGPFPGRDRRLGVAGRRLGAHGTGVRL